MMGQRAGSIGEGLPRSVECRGTKEEMVGIRALVVFECIQTDPRERQEERIGNGSR